MNRIAENISCFIIWGHLVLKNTILSIYNFRSFSVETDNLIFKYKQQCKRSRTEKKPCEKELSWWVDTTWLQEFISRQGDIHVSVDKWVEQNRVQKISTYIWPTDIFKKEQRQQSGEKPFQQMFSGTSRHLYKKEKNLHPYESQFLGRLIGSPGSQRRR